MTLTVTVYVVTDADGNHSVDAATLDGANRIVVGGRDRHGQYWQFDSAEAYHVYEWAAKHGFAVETREIKVDLETGR